MLRHPHPRELIAHVAATLLDYIFARSELEDNNYDIGDNDGQGRDNDDRAGTATGARDEDAAAVVELFRQGTNGESAEGYLRTLEALRAKSKSRVAGDTKTQRPSSSRASSSIIGKKRKASAGREDDSIDDDATPGMSVVVLDTLGSTASIPKKPTTMPVLIEIEAHLANADVTSAIALCQSFESSSVPSDNDKREGWYHILRYLDQKDMLFDPTKDDDAAEEDRHASLSLSAKSRKSRIFHLLHVGSVGLTAVKWFFAEYADNAIVAAVEARKELSSTISPNEIPLAREVADSAAEHSSYVQFQVRRTMLKFLLSRNHSPAAALKEAEAIATPIDPDGRSGTLASYVGVETGAHDGNTQALRKIQAILSTRYGEPFPSMYLPRLEGAITALPAAPAPALLQGSEVTALEAAPAAIEDYGEVEDEEIVAQEEEEGATPVDDSSVEEPPRAAAPESGASTDEVILLDDSDEEEIGSVGEAEHDDEEDTSSSEAHYDEPVREEDQDEYDEVSDGEGTRSEGSEPTSPGDSDVVEVIESSSEDENEQEQQEVHRDEDHQEEEPAIEVDQQEQQEVDNDIDERIEPSCGAHEEEEVIAEEDRRHDRGEDEGPLSDDMDEADEATVEEEVSARDEALSEEEDEKARRQHQEDLRRQQLNSQRRQAIVDRESASASAPPPLTMIPLQLVQVLMPIFQSTSRKRARGRSQEPSWRWNTGLPNAKRVASDIPRDEHGDAEPDSLLVAVAMDVSEMGGTRSQEDVTTADVLRAREAFEEPAEGAEETEGQEEEEEETRTS